MIGEVKFIRSGGKTYAFYTPIILVSQLGVIENGFVNEIFSSVNVGQTVDNTITRMHTDITHVSPLHTSKSAEFLCRF